MTAVAIVIVLALASAAAFFAFNRREFSRLRCPILLYHRFVRREADLDRYPGTESIFTVTADKLDAQLSFLKAQGYAPVGLAEIDSFLGDCTGLPRRPVAITVDDGWQSNLEIMVPILEKHDVRASFFVTTSPEAWIYKKFEGLDGPLSRDQVRDLHRRGHEIGSHSVTHPHLIELPDDQIRHEFVASKQWIEDATGAPCRFLSIPGNFYDARVQRLAREAGYDAVFTANVGSVCRGTDRWDIRRLIVEGNFTLEEFERNLRPLTICTRKIIATIKKWPPHLLGATRYMALRERLFNSPLRALFILRRLKMIALALGLLVLVALTLLLAR